MAASEEKLQIYDVDQIDCSKLEFNKPNKLGNGMLIYAAYNNSKYLYMHFPRLRIPFDTKKDQFGGYRVAMEVKASQSDYHARFFNKIQKIDEQVVKHIKEKYDTWTESMPKKDRLYSGSLSYSPGYDPKMFAKFLMDKTTNETFALDEAKNQINLNSENAIEKTFKRNNEIRGILQFSGIYISADRISPLWKLVQVRVFETQQASPLDQAQIDKMADTLMIDDSSDEE